LDAEIVPYIEEINYTAETCPFSETSDLQDRDFEK